MQQFTFYTEGVQIAFCNSCNRSKVLSDHLFIKILLRHKQKFVHQNLNCLNPTEGPQL